MLEKLAITCRIAFANVIYESNYFQIERIRKLILANLWKYLIK
jgi:hypothetical protein